MNLVTILILTALAATVVSFGWGIGSMAHGGTYDEKHSEQLMSARVIFQAIAVLVLLAAVYFSLA